MKMSELKRHLAAMRSELDVLETSATSLSTLYTLPSWSSTDCESYLQLCSDVMGAAFTISIHASNLNCPHIEPD